MRVDLSQVPEGWEFQLYYDPVDKEFGFMIGCEDRPCTEMNWSKIPQEAVDNAVKAWEVPL